MKKLGILLVGVLFLAGVIFAQGVILKEENVGTSLKKVICIDNITINPNTRVVTIRTFVSFQDENGKEIKRDRGETIVLRDVEDDPNTEVDETKTEYSDFIKATRLNFDVVVKVVKEIVKKQKEVRR